MIQKIKTMIIQNKEEVVEEKKDVNNEDVLNKVNKSIEEQDEIKKQENNKESIDLKEEGKNEE